MQRMMRWRGVSALVATGAVLAVAVLGCAPVDDRRGQTDAAQPTQPTTGPGSASAVAADVRTTAVGGGAQQVFIYEPAGTELTSAPVIIFLHGYSGINPRVYGAWIKHLVLRGNIVLYPVYQEALNHPELYTGDALASVQAAYAELRNGEHILPHETRLAIAGHSLGGTIGMNLAAVAHTSGLPRVLALMAANPGDADAKTRTVPRIQTDNYDQIPAEMLYLGVVGADDDVVGRAAAERFFNALTQIPLSNREVIELASDEHGTPVLRADHHAPLAFDQAFDSGQNLRLLPSQIAALFTGGLLTGEDSLDAFDYYGYWKWFDALTDAAFYGTNLPYALGNTTEQTSLGNWSDGQAIVPAVRIDPAP